MASYRLPPLSYRLDDAIRAGFWWNIEKRIPHSERDRFDTIAAFVYRQRKRAEHRAQPRRNIVLRGVAFQEFGATDSESLRGVTRTSERGVAVEMVGASHLEAAGVRCPAGGPERTTISSRCPRTGDGSA